MEQEFLSLHKQIEAIERGDWDNQLQAEKSEQVSELQETVTNAAETVSTPVKAEEFGTPGSGTKRSRNGQRKGSTAPVPPEAEVNGENEEQEPLSKRPRVETEPQPGDKGVVNEAEAMDEDQPIVNEEAPEPAQPEPVEQATDQKMPEAEEEKEEEVAEHIEQEEEEPPKPEVQNEEEEAAVEEPQIVDVEVEGGGEEAKPTVESPPPEPQEEGREVIPSPKQPERTPLPTVTKRESSEPESDGT